VNNNIVERLMGSARERTKVMRGFKDPLSANTILDGWVTYYNFIRPHMSLGGMTPAEKIGIEMGLNGGNRWENLIECSVI